jgi:three-Cys-motif partner protein
VHEGDCNEILLRDVLPRADYRQYRRAVCLLDPYSLQLDWRVIETAGKMKSIEVFLNFPIMDINRSVLHGRATARKLDQMTRFWGDDSWRDVAFRDQPTLFGDVDHQKVANWELVRAFRDRLLEAANFTIVPAPLAMKNSTRAAVYYLFFAGNNKTGGRIVDWIFKDYREKGYG